MPGDSDQQKLISDDNLLGEIAEVFVDDTVAKSKKKQDHINDLARVLIRLVANRITIKMEKGLWDTDEVFFLTWDSGLFQDKLIKKN